MPPSVDPRMSAMANSGAWSMRPRFTFVVNMAPDEIISFKLDVSQRSGSVSNARRSGLAKASPTMMICETRSRSIVSHTSSGLKPRFSSSTEVPPSMCGNIKPSQQPVPCMSGGPDIATTAELASTICLAAGANLSAFSKGSKPIMGGKPRMKNSVKPSSGYITPLGIPVVPPV